jgi:hypothetical protein
VTASSKARVSDSWIKLLKVMNVKYIVIDKTLNTYSKYYELVERTLNDKFALIYEGSSINIYEVAMNSQPLHVISNGNVTIEYLKKKPYDTLLILRSQNTSSFILVLPMPHLGSLPDPFKVSVKSREGGQVELQELDYSGLRGYLINFQTAGDTLYVRVTYDIGYITVAVLYFGYMFSPLIVLAITALRKIVK